MAQITPPTRVRFSLVWFAPVSLVQWCFPVRWPHQYSPERAWALELDKFGFRAHLSLDFFFGKMDYITVSTQSTQAKENLRMSVSSLPFSVSLLYFCMCVWWLQEEVGFPSLCFYSIWECFCGLPWWLPGKESICQCWRVRFDPWIRKIPWSK